MAESAIMLNSILADSTGKGGTSALFAAMMTLSFRHSNLKILIRSLVGSFSRTHLTL